MNKLKDNQSPISKCEKCDATSEKTIIFEVIGSIMAHKKNIYGGIVGNNIAKGKNENWEKQRPNKPIISDDGSLRIYRMLFCKKCLMSIISKIR